MIERKYGYDRTTKRWADLDAGDYVIGKDGDLWRVLAMPDHVGTVRAKGGPRDEEYIWAAQPDDREVPIALLHPIDPVSLLRDLLGATPMAWKRHEDGTWRAAPWPTTKPGNHPLDDYRSHMIEWHGVRPPGNVEWDDLVRMHTEHHTPGIAHPVDHYHPAPRLAD